MDILKIVGKPLYQWDTGRKLLLTVPEEVEINEVQFSNIYVKSALVAIPYLVEEKMYVNIPNILLQDSGQLSVWVVRRTGNGEETLCHYTYKVSPKKKPEDYVYTETEILNYISLKKRIEEMEKSGGVSDEQIAEAVENYLIENPIEGGSGEDGASAYEISVKNGFKGTEKEWLESLNGSDGKNGADGKDGLNGSDGADGKTAYQYAQDGGYTGSEKEFAEKLAQENPTKEEFSKLSEDKVDKPSVATVGQILAVKAIDENGKPTELECIDKTSDSSDSSNWELIVNHTVEENCSNLLFTKDVNGNPFNLKKLFVLVKIMPNVEGGLTSIGYVKINTDNKIHPSWQVLTGYGFCRYPTSTENYRKGYAVLEKISNKVIMTENRMSFNGNSVKDELCYVSDYSYAVTVLRDDVIQTEINQVHIISFNDAIGAGSVIEVYGIREVES